MRDALRMPQGDFYDYCQLVRRTIREVLEEFRSSKIPREYLFDLFPPLRPREFSIAGSIHVSSDRNFTGTTADSLISDTPDASNSALP